MAYFNIFKALHIICMVCWFAGIFYLPRLFVYHAMSNDKVSQDRFVIMERKLYRGIMNPAMMTTWVFGLIMAYLGRGIYFHQGWFHAKLTLVILLTIYHIICGNYRKKLAHNPHLKSHKFWRVFNEIPVVILIAVVFLVVTKPF